MSVVEKVRRKLAQNVAQSSHGHCTRAAEFLPEIVHISVNDAAVECQRAGTYI